jgi:dihydroneopterin aldolase
VSDPVKLDGIIPPSLAVKSSRILLDSLEVMTDIGFHDYEIGAPQRLLVTVELWLEQLDLPADDDPANAWDYDFLRTEILRLAGERRYNLQETLARRIYDRLAALHGVAALRVVTAKPDIYSDALGVGVEIASFEGTAPRLSKGS